MKALNWLTKAPFYRLGIIAIILFLIIALAEGEAYWVGGVSVILYLFLLAYAKLIKHL